MKLLELDIDNVQGVGDGTYSFADSTGSPYDLVLLGDDPEAVLLLQTVAALLEAMRAPTPARDAQWWAGRRGVAEARLRARWALTEGDAALAGVPGLTATSDWRFGPCDDYPRAVPVNGGLAHARTEVARYAFLDATNISVWIEADPLVELLAGIARQDVVATRALCKEGVGAVGFHTPDTLAVLTQTIASVFPALRLERVAAARGEAPVACFRDGERVELDALPEIERDAIHIAATFAMAAVRDGVILVDRPDRHVPQDERGRWFDWLGGLAGTNQLIVAASPGGLPAQSARAGS